MLISAIIASIYQYREQASLAKKNINYEYVEIDMSSKFKEGEISPLDEVMGEGISYFDFINNLEKIKSNSRVKGLIFKLDNFSLTRAQSEEVGKIVEEISKTKEVYSYSTGFNRASYYFAANSNKIFMPGTSSATSNIGTYSVELPFYKRIADKAGVKFTVVHMGAYKSFGENLVSTSMSEFSKENTLNILNKSFDEFLESVSIKRGIEKNALEKKIIDGELISAIPDELLENKLIDSKIYYEDFKETIGSKKIIPYLDYKDLIERKPLISVSYKEKKDKIALIFLDGEITEDSAPTKSGSITETTTIELLDKAFKDKDVKGIVLRVNSPGGSALVSDIIHEKIKNGKKEKPVYISMGSVAASGGYYISSAGDRIFVNKNTVTGSIGVVSIIPNFEEIAKKIGVDMNILQKGEKQNIYSLFQPVDDTRINTLLKSNERVYNEFKGHVAEGRRMSLEKVEKVAQGRVWTGKDAVSNGLADEIASLPEVIVKLATKLNLEKENYEIDIIERGDMKGEIKGYLKLFRKNASIYFNKSIMDRFYSILKGNALEEEIIEKLSEKIGKVAVYNPDIEKLAK